MIEELIKKMQLAIGHLKEELAQIRTGRATPNLISEILIDVYGTKMAIKELAQINAPEPTILLVSPWDKSILSNIVNGISKANIGLNGAVDGDLIRIVVPALTVERRDQLIKQMHQLVEKYKVEIRQIRHEYVQSVRDQKKNSQIGEDEEKRLEGEIQKQHDKIISEIDDLGKSKEEQLRQV